MKVRGNNVSKSVVSEKVTFRSGPVSKPQKPGCRKEGEKNLTFVEIPQLDTTILFL